jgi:CheY-like chemotaxis protein
MSGTSRQAGEAERMGELQRKRRILVVDDEPAMRSVLRLLLKRNYDVTLAESCESARRRLDAGDGRFDLVVLDRMFPLGAMQGEELLQVIHVRWPSLLVVMLTVDYQVPPAVQCTKLGAFQFVSKQPNLQANLVPVVAAAMDFLRHREASDAVEKELHERRLREEAMNTGLAAADAPLGEADPQRVRDFETVRREHYLYAYHAHHGNLAQAARGLHVSYDSYRDQLIAWGVHLPRRPTPGPDPGPRRRQ